MALYVDTSALLKRYVDEPDSDRAVELLASDPDLVTGRHAIVEVRRNLAKILDPVDAAAARVDFIKDLRSFALIELDANTCELAASIAEETGVRTLDSFHLGAAMRLGGGVGFLTFDIRQAVAARQLGLAVTGV